MNSVYFGEYYRKRISVEPYVFQAVQKIVLEKYGFDITGLRGFDFDWGLSIDATDVLDVFENIIRLGGVLEVYGGYFNKTEGLRFYRAYKKVLKKHWKDFIYNSDEDSFACLFDGKVDLNKALLSKKEKRELHYHLAIGFLEDLSYFVVEIDMQDILNLVPYETAKRLETEIHTLIQ